MSPNMDENALSMLGEKYHLEIGAEEDRSQSHAKKELRRIPEWHIGKKDQYGSNRKGGQVY